MLNSGFLSKKSRITSSFSSSLKVQVLYSILPPALSMFFAQDKICFCLSAQIFGLFSFHSRREAGFFLNIPSPEQGASTSILSKQELKIFSSSLGLLFKTTQFESPILSMFLDSIFALFWFISFATRQPVPLSMEASWVDFPPGAAHKSRMNSCSFGAKTSAGSIALGS